MKYLKNTVCYLLPYTIVFIVFSFVFLIELVHDDKILLWNPDGLGQHFVSFVYLCNYLENIIHLNSISFFDFHIGQGADVLTTLNSYDFTDPICWISALIYPISIESRYVLMIFIKLYLTGISFIIYCISIGFKSKFQNSLGALSYAFSGAVVFYFARHPNFIHYTYYAPLIFAGVECFARKNKYSLLLFSLFFNIVVNFYCAYIDLLLLVIYIIILNFHNVFVNKTSSIRKEIYIDFKIFLICLISLLLSSFVFIPTLYSYLNNGRLNTITGYTDSFLFFYPHHYVEYIFNLFIPSIFQSSVHIGMNIFCLFSIIYCLLKNRNVYFICFVIFTLMSCIPFFGLVFNGFGYVSSRWTFIIPFFASVLIVITVHNIDSICKKLWNKIHVYIALFIFLFVFLPESDYNTQSFVICIILMFEFLLFKYKTKIMPCFIILIGAFFILYLTFFTPGNEYLSQFPHRSALENYFIDSSSMAKEIDNNFFRVEKNESNQISCNTSIFNKVFGVSLRWSMIPYYVKNFYTYLGFSTTIGNCIFLGFDNRTIPSTLAGVKYYTCPIESKTYAPYGFDFLKCNSNYAIFKNKFYLPVAYLYNNTFPETQLPQDDPLAIENIMLNCAIVEDCYNIFYDKLKIQQNKEIKYNFYNFNNIVIKNNEINVLDKNNFCELIFKPVNIIDKEIFVVINGIKLDSNNKQVLMSIENKTNRYEICKKASISNSRHLWHSGMDSVVFNLGSNIENVCKFRLSFDKRCNIKYENIKIIVRNNKNYKNSIFNIKQNLPFDIYFKNDTLLLKTNSPTTKILHFSIPFSEGWEGYVDDKNVNIFRSNIMYTAMIIDKGFHKIKLVYHTPYLKHGVIISFITLIFIIFFECFKGSFLNFFKRN